MSQNVTRCHTNILKSTDSTRCELVRGGLTTRAKPPQGASARTRRGRSARRRNSTTNQPSLHKIVCKHETAQTHCRGCASVLNAGRAGSRPHSSQPAQLAGFPVWRRQQLETEHPTTWLIIGILNQPTARTIFSLGFPLYIVGSYYP